LDAIEAEEARAESAESDLADDIAAEASARQSAISSEASSRAAAVSALEAADASEASARQSADNALDARLDVLEGSGEGSVAKAKSDAQAYADQKVADLVNSAPAILDTLKELADAIGSDANFATTVANNIASEASARQSADEDLQDAIDALDASVAAALSSASGSLASDLAAETAAREAADATHTADIATKLNKPTSGDAASKYLRSNGDGSTFWDVGYILPVHKSNWSAASGTSKSVSHNLGTTDVVVTIIDLSDNQVIGVQSVTVSDANSVSLTASEAPSASGWRIMVQAL
jgi:hypothetical protein